MQKYGDFLKSNKAIGFDIETIYSPLGEEAFPFVSTIGEKSYISKELVSSRDFETGYLELTQSIKKQYPDFVPHKGSRLYAKRVFDDWQKDPKSYTAIQRNKISTKVTEDIIAAVDDRNILFGYNVGYDVIKTAKDIPEAKQVEFKQLFDPGGESKTIEAAFGKYSKKTPEGYEYFTHRYSNNKLLEDAFDAIKAVKQIGEENYKFKFSPEGRSLAYGTRQELLVPFIEKARGISRKGMSHTSIVDVESSKDILKYLSEEIVPELLEYRGKDLPAGSKANKFFNYLEDIIGPDSAFHALSEREQVLGDFERLRAAKEAKEAGAKHIEYKVRGKSVHITDFDNPMSIYDTLSDVGFEHKIERGSYQNLMKEYSSLDNYDYINEINKIKGEGNSKLELIAERALKQNKDSYELRGFTGKSVKPEFYTPSASTKRFRNVSLGIGAGVLGLIGAYSLFGGTKISGKDDDYNVVEGLKHTGVGGEQRKYNTDFGSGFKGSFVSNLISYKNIASKVGKNLILNLPGIIKDLPSSMYQGVKANKTLFFGSMGFGLYKGLKSDERFEKKDILKATAFDLADDVLAFSFGSAIKTMEKDFPNISSKPWVAKTENILQKTGVALTGYFVGNIAGKMFNSMFSGKDDTYNTIEAFKHEGVAGVNRRRRTDFGSGYRGLADDDYNNAQDVPRHQLYRGSKIGIPDWEVYQYMTQPEKPTSDYVAQTARAGTALHELEQAQAFKRGEISASEIFVHDPVSQIGGHIDVIDNVLGVKDIKTVNSGIFDTIMREGRPKPMHVDQVQFYLGTLGEKHGAIEYIDRDKPHRKKVFTVDFNPYRHHQLLRKVERQRERVEAEIQSGELIANSLPKTASVERLKEAQRNRPSPEEHISNIPYYRQQFNQEMSTLNTIKRGMPRSGPGAERIKRRNEMQSTMGLPLQIHNDRIGHHIM
jgi:hypothetical protein